MSNLPPTEDQIESANRLFAETVVEASEGGVAVGLDRYRIFNVGRLAIAALYQSREPLFGFYIEPTHINAEEPAICSYVLRYGFLDPSEHRVRKDSVDCVFSLASWLNVHIELSAALDRRSHFSPDTLAKRSLDRKASWQRVFTEKAPAPAQSETEDDARARLFAAAFAGMRPLDDAANAHMVALAARLVFREQAITMGLFDIEPDEVVRVSEALRLAANANTPAELKHAERTLSDILGL